MTLASPRRRLLALSMVWYGLLHLACAMAPGMAALLPLRVLAVIAAAIFTPQAAACVGLLVPPEQRGRAITFVFLGWSVASVLGMPLAAFIGGTLGWRSAFVAVGILSLASAVWVWRDMPNGIRPPALSLAAWRETLRSPALMLCIAVTVLYSAGQFVVFSYFAPYYKQVLNVTPGQLPQLRNGPEFYRDASELAADIALLHGLLVEAGAVGGGGDVAGGAGVGKLLHPGALGAQENDDSVPQTVG